MIEPRPQVILEMFSLAIRHRCADAELQAAVDIVTQRTLKGRPQNKIYGRLLWAMFALVGIYGGSRFTAANLIIRLADRPVAQRENQARALVRRFDECLKDEPLRKTQEFYAGYGAGMRVAEFYTTWEWSRLPSPPGIKSATDRETELATLAMASNGAIDAAIRDYIVALDQSLAALVAATVRT